MNHFDLYCSLFVPRNIDIVHSLSLPPNLVRKWLYFQGANAADGDAHGHRDSLSLPPNLVRKWLYFQGSNAADGDAHGGAIDHESPGITYLNHFDLYCPLFVPRNINIVYLLSKWLHFKGANAAGTPTEEQLTMNRRESLL